MDPDVYELLVELVRETPRLGETPRARCLEYLHRTQTHAVACLSIGAEPTGGRVMGDEMVTLEIPAAYFDRLVLNDRRYRKEKGLP